MELYLKQNEFILKTIVIFIELKIKKMDTQKETTEKVLKLLSVKDYKNIVEEIENSMERWHLGRDNDSETLNDINNILYKNGYLSFFNDKQNKISKTK